MVTSTRWRSRIVGHGEEAPDQLVANPRNWRIHPQGQQDALTALLDQVGWVQDVVVNQRTGYVVDGHLRVALAISRDEATVPVTYVDLTPGEEALVLAALDPLSAMAVTDEDALRALLADVSVDSDSLMAMLAAIAPPAPTAGLTDPDAVPEVAEVTTTVGELYALGSHRLLIGDATSEADVARLLNGERPHLHDDRIADVELKRAPVEQASLAAIVAQGMTPGTIAGYADTQQIDSWRGRWVRCSVSMDPHNPDLTFGRARAVRTGVSIGRRRRT